MPVADARRNRLLQVTSVAILLLGLLAYAPALRFEYAQDAHIAVEHNPVVQRGDVAEIFGSDYWKDTASIARTLYRPVSVLSFAAEYRLQGAAVPWLSHLINVILHLSIALLLFAYARRLGASVAVSSLTALSFTVHPLLLQPVANVAGRPDLLAVLFSLAALLTLSAAGGWNGRPSPGPVRHRLAVYGGALLLFLALGAKESAVATPLLVLAQEWLYRSAPRGRDGTWWLRRLASLAPAGLALFVFFLLRTQALEDPFGLQRVFPMDNVLVGMEGVPRSATTLAMAGRYVLLLLLPLELSGDYSGTVIRPESSLLAPLALVGLVALIVLMSLLFASRIPALRECRSSRRLLRMDALLIMLPYLVVGNVFVLNGAGFAERLIYFSATGFCLLTSVLLVWLWGLVSRGGMQRLGVALVGLLLVAAALQTRHQSRMWRSDEALFEHALRSTPRSLRAHFGLASIRLRQGNVEQTLALYESAVRYSPDHGQSWGHIGVLRLSQGDLDDGVTALRRSIELWPRNPGALLALGLALDRRGELEQAERLLRRALLLDSELARVRVVLGRVSLSLGVKRSLQGDIQGAEEALRRAVQFAPEVAESRAYLGRALARQGRWVEAETAFREALRLDPELDTAHEGLGHVLFQTGRYREAAAVFRRCVANGLDHLREFLREAEARAARAP